MAAAAFKEDRMHGPTVAKIFHNMYLVEDVKRFTSSMIKFKSSLKISLFVQDQFPYSHVQQITGDCYKVQNVQDQQEYLAKKVIMAELTWANLKKWTD